MSGRANGTSVQVRRLIGRQKGLDLAGLMFSIAAFAAWANAKVNCGYYLADQLCGLGRSACNHPKWLMLAALVLGLVALYRASVRQ